jgi:hypothetical protein
MYTSHLSLQNDGVAAAVDVAAMNARVYKPLEEVHCVPEEFFDNNMTDLPVENVVQDW